MDGAVGGRMNEAVATYFLHLHPYYPLNSQMTLDGEASPSRSLVSDITIPTLVQTTWPRYTEITLVGFDEMLSVCLAVATAGIQRSSR
jgi:hypothetical protein